MSRSSFLRSVPRSGAALCSAGSLGLVPQFLSSYCGTPTSRPPASLSHCASLGGSVFRRRKRELPSSSATLATHAPVYDSGGIYSSRPRGFAPTSCSLDVVFRPVRIVDFRHLKTDFGVQLRGLRARCLRFVSVVTFRSRKTRFRLTALPCRAGLQPAGSLAWFPFLFLALHGFLQGEARLAHARARLRGNSQFRDRP
jgi:hypothetical protein